jgi:hypothetical protein
LTINKIGLFVLLQCEQGYCSSHLYFFSLHRSQAWAARGRLARLGADSSGFGEVDW